MSNNAAVAPIIVLEVNDVTSGARVFELELNPLSLGNLVTGSGEVTALIRLVNESAIGKHLETDTISIDGAIGDKLPKGGWEQYEQDGWTCRRSDYGNHHRNTGNKYSVTRSRLVDEASDASHKDRLDGRDVLVAQALDIAKNNNTEKARYYVDLFVKAVKP